MTSINPEILQRALLREKAARKQAEKILEDKSKELYLITEQLRKANKKLQSGLTEKTTELQGVFDNLVDAYVLMNLKGEIINLNGAAKELFGYDVSEENINVIQLIYKDDFEYAINSFKLLISKGFFSDYIARVNTKNKGIRWVHINASIIKNSNQKPIGAQGIVKDITNQRAIETQNKKLLHDLEKSNEELGEYAHIVSHDLKSPLRSINALVNWLREDYENILDDSGLKNISLIEQTLEKMEHLINGILNYSSINNNTDLKNTAVDINSVLQDIISTIYIPSHTTVTALQQLPTIKGDKTRIQQLFQNIISNAVNYIDKEVGTVSVSFEENQSHYIFQIKDNGIGIEKEHFDKIFKIFQSLGNNKNSTGIGLSIVKKIVEAYEGEIWLKSEPKVGTSFFFSLKK